MRQKFTLILFLFQYFVTKNPYIFIISFKVWSTNIAQKGSILKGFWIWEVQKRPGSELLNPDPAKKGGGSWRDDSLLSQLKHFPTYPISNRLEKEVFYNTDVPLSRMYICGLKIYKIICRSIVYSKMLILFSKKNLILCYLQSYE